LLEPGIEPGTFRSSI